MGTLLAMEDDKEDTEFYLFQWLEKYWIHGNVLRYSAAHRPVLEEGPGSIEMAVLRGTFRTSKGISQHCLQPMTPVWAHQSLTMQISKVEVLSHGGDKNYAVVNSSDNGRDSATANGKNASECDGESIIEVCITEKQQHSCHHKHVEFMQTSSICSVATIWEHLGVDAVQRHVESQHLQDKDWVLISPVQYSVPPNLNSRKHFSRVHEGLDNVLGLDIPGVKLMLRKDDEFGKFSKSVKNQGCLIQRFPLPLHCWQIFAPIKGKIDMKERLRFWAYGVACTICQES